MNEALKDYDIGPEIGRGGMATVHRGVRRQDGVAVALKFLSVPDGPQRDVMVRKFRQEARLLQVLDHPNLVKVFDFGVTETGIPWLAMELIEGTVPAAGGKAAQTAEGTVPAAGGKAAQVAEGTVPKAVTLAERLAQARPLGEEDVRRIYGQLRGALAYCHEKGIVHGDVKAENVLMLPDGTVKLADFGIARILDDETRNLIGSTATMTGFGNLATPYIRAPECRGGAKSTPVADVYSLGILLYKLVTGIWYEGSPRLLAQARRFAPLWSVLLVQMLQDEPARRIQSAACLPVDPVGDARRKRNHRRLFLIAAGASIFLLGASALTLVGTVPTRPGTVPSQSMGTVPSQSMGTVPTQSGTASDQSMGTVPTQMGSVPNEIPSSRDSTLKDVPEIKFARKMFGTNDFDYVCEATLTHTNRLHLVRPIVYGTLHLPDQRGPAMIWPPAGYEKGPVVVVFNPDGDLFNQTHLVRRRDQSVWVNKHVISIRPRDTL